MNVSFEEAVRFVEAKLREQNPNNSLSKVERIILTAAWDDQTYVNASKEYDVPFNTLQSHAGPLLWRKLSESIGKKVGKKTFKQVISLKYAESVFQSDSNAKEEQFVIKGASLPLLDGFVGRRAETESLLTLINKYACILLVGLEGIGKKSLVANLINEKQNHLPIKRVLWKPLVHRPSAEELEQELLSIIGGKKDDDLLELLCRTPYIIVLDSIDYLHVEKDGCPSLDTEYENLLRRISEETLSKLIVITTQQTEASLNLVLRGRTTTYNLGGLSLSESKAILGEQWDGDACKELWKTTGGHPLMLHEAAKWKDYAPDLRSQIKRLTVLANLFGHFYEKIFKRLMLSSSDVNLLKEISAYTQGVPFSVLLRKDPTSMVPVANLITMGLVRKASNDNGEAIIHTPPLLNRALMGA